MIVRATAGLAVLLGLVLAAGCTADEPGSDPGPLSSPAAPTPPPTASPPPRPERGACYLLDYDEAIAPTSTREPVACDDGYTTRTYRVGRLDRVVDGHLLAVDSPQVQRRLARRCPRLLAEWLDADEDQVRLSMFRPVWFSPTLEQAAAGEDWFRCDAVVVDRPEELLALQGPLRGALGSPAGRQRYGMCATARPGSEAFERVVCSRDDAWRAIAVVGLGQGRFPGVETVREAGRQPCEDAAREAAADPLNFTWGYEWPTRERWRGGTTYGVCWTPGSSEGP